MGRPQTINPSRAALTARRTRARARGEEVPMMKPGPKLGSRYKIRHGTRNEYSKHGCRCEQCRTAANKHAREQVNPEIKRRAVRKCQNRYRDFLRSQKDKPCTDCGIKYPYYVMQFDHLRDKQYSLSSLSASIGRQKLIKELEKCEVVCANCHAERTFQRIKQSFVSQNS